MNRSPELPDHEYDGIREMNHPAPRWWQMAFYASIAFGVAYFAWYELGDGQSIQAEFTREMRAIEYQAALERAATPPPGPEELERLARDPIARQAGQALFQTKCASCHGAHGEGGIGPNLTDDHWINGDGKPSALYSIVERGISERGMPPWGGLLAREELAVATGFVRSLRGTRPANPKAPQGSLQKD